LLDACPVGGSRAGVKLLYESKPWASGVPMPAVFRENSARAFIEENALCAKCIDIFT